MGKFSNYKLQTCLLDNTKQKFIHKFLMLNLCIMIGIMNANCTPYQIAVDYLNILLREVFTPSFLYELKYSLKSRINIIYSFNQDLDYMKRGMEIRRVKSFINIHIMGLKYLFLFFLNLPMVMVCSQISLLY